MRLLAVVLAGLALAGCAEKEVSARDTRVVTTAQSDISFYCLDGSYRERIPRHIDRLIAIYRKDPDAVLVESSEDQAPMHIVLQQIARSMDGCDDRRAQQLRDAVED